MALKLLDRVAGIQLPGNLIGWLASVPAGPNEDELLAELEGLEGDELVGSVEVLFEESQEEDEGEEEEGELIFPLPQSRPPAQRPEPTYTPRPSAAPLLRPVAPARPTGESQVQGRAARQAQAARPPRPAGQRLLSKETLREFWGFNVGVIQWLWVRPKIFWLVTVVIALLLVGSIWGLVRIQRAAAKAQRVAEIQAAAEAAATAQAAAQPGVAEQPGAPPAEGEAAAGAAEGADAAPALLESGGTVDQGVEKIDSGESWFTLEEAPKQEPDMRPMFRTHSNIVAFITDPDGFDWGILLWLAIGFTAYGLVIRERLREQQPHDILLIVGGWAWFFALTLLDQELTTFILRRSAIIDGTPVSWPPQTVTAVVDVIAVLGAILFWLAAVLSVRRDLTPMSGSLFGLGMYFIITNPVAWSTKFTIGFLFILGGLIVHVVELESQHARAGAIGLIVGMLPVFIGIRVGIDLLLSLMVLIPNPEDWAAVLQTVIGWLLRAIYTNRGTIAFGLAFLISYGAAERSAEFIFGRILRATEQEEGSFAGRHLPTEETASIDTVLLFLFLIAIGWIVIGNPLTPILDLF